MITLKAKSVSLYLEGLMILTFDRRAKLLEAAPLSKAGHDLAGVIHRRRLGKDGTQGKWRKERDDPFARSDIRDFATGRIFIEDGGAMTNASAALSNSTKTVDGEQWRQFNGGRGIPDLENEFFGRRVTLNYNSLKPSLRISTGTFYSVLSPIHPGVKATPVILKSLRVERDALKNLRATTSPPVSKDEIRRRLGSARRSLDIKAYTAATRLDLRHGQSLVCQLKKNTNAEPVEVLRIEYDPNYELRMAIRNFPVAKGHRSEDPEDDPINSFHSLHFYDAVIGIVEPKFILSDENKQGKYVNKKRVKFEPETGGGNPCCPIGGRSGTITG